MGQTDRELEVLGGGSASGVAIEPVSITDRLGTTETTYQTVVQWAVPAGVSGFLREIAFISDQPARTQWRLTIGGAVKWADRLFLSTLSILFPDDTRLDPETVVLLEAQSTDGTLITADGSISGAERS